MLVLFIFCILISTVVSEPSNKEQLESWLIAIDQGTQEVQFLSAELLFRQIREAITSRAFPIELFPPGVGRVGKNAEIEATRLAEAAHTLRTDWQERKNGARLLDELVDAQMMFARVEVLEFAETFEQLLERRKTFALARADLYVALIDGYRPNSYLGILFADHSRLVNISSYVVMLGIPLLLFSPHRRWRNMFLMALLLGIMVASFAITTTMLNYVKLNWGVPTAVRDARATLLAAIPYCDEFEIGAMRINASVWHLQEYCEAMDMFNSTVLQGVMQFSERVTSLVSADATEPEMALELVTQTRERLGHHKTALQRLGASRSGNPKTNIEKLLLFLNYFELFFSQLEITLYSNLKLGYQLNRFFLENLHLLHEHIERGQLLPCVAILTDIHRQELSQFGALSKANDFVRATNDAVERIRNESGRIQPELQSEEMMFWIKQTASTVGMYGSSLLPVMAIVALPALTLVPATAIAGGVALLGYNWKQSFASAEVETRDLMQEILHLNEILESTETRLTNYEKMLGTLLGDIWNVIRYTNQSSHRMQFIKVRRTLLTREQSMLRDGVVRVEKAIEQLEKRYERALETLFQRIVSSRPPAPPLALPLTNDVLHPTAHQKEDHPSETTVQTTPATEAG